jgi:hypothetical protein
VGQKCAVKFESDAGFALVDFMADVVGQKGKHTLPVFGVKAVVVLLYGI